MKINNTIEKICKGCNITKPVSDYWLDSRKRKDGVVTYRHLCKDCYRIKGTNDERQRKLKKYGITAEQYEEERIKQNYSCLLCGAHENTQRHNKLHIDHCHTTGKYRGLLCSNCNLGLGKFSDNVEVLERAAKYVYENSARYRNK
jgi:hypothetical protein